MPELEIEEAIGAGAVAAIGRAIRAKRDELRTSAVMRYYGAALTTTHSLSLVLFWRHDFLVRTITGDDAVCWPFLPDCASWRTHSVAAVHASMIAYGVLALATMIAFVRRDHAGKALVGLAVLGLIKGAWFLHDYRLMGNYHYMPFILTSVFLLVPRAND